TDDLYSGQIGEVQVQYDNLWTRDRGQADRMLALADHGHDLIPRLGEIPRDAVPPHRVVVDHHDPHGASLRTRDPLAGNSQLHLGPRARRTGDRRRALEVADPAADRLHDTETSGRLRLRQPRWHHPDSVVANRDGDDVALVLQQNPGPAVGARVRADVVQG